MNKYEMIEVERAIKACQRGHSSFRKQHGRYKKKPKPWRSSHRKWDVILRKVCMGCGRTLGRYELYNNYAWCYNCRKYLFPETVLQSHSHYGGNKPLSFHSRQFR